MKKLVPLLSLFLFMGCSENVQELHLYSWSDYISPSAIAKFEAENGCKIVIDSFDSNEAAYAKLKLGASGYDIVFPSSYQVDLMAKEGMLEELDPERIQNVKANFDCSYENQILDPSFRYSVPYVVTYTGFAYRKDKVSEKDVSSWAVFGNRAMTGKFTLLDDMREVIGAGLMYNGFSVNSVSQTEIDKSVDTVLSWRPNVRKFDAESYRTEVPNGSTWVGHGYSSDTMQVIFGEGESPRDDIGFAFPKEGFSVTFDEMVILKGSANKDLAYQFINFMYRTNIAAENMEYVCGPMPHKEALAAIPEHLRKLMVPDHETMRYGQVIKSFTDRPDVQEMYNKAWDQIKAIK